MENMKIDGDSRLHSVLQPLHTECNRDVNAANYIYSLAARAIDGLPRPPFSVAFPPTSAAAPISAVSTPPS
ncbi:hypothetical protein [Absidia glauca]|uniref:Uncharacterized protein n=1 Tax=Absidia glauca TaxID=4829 RepID=A0A163K239_ABSGL|nr:hypothetical protein [Absidia glauca]